MSENKQYAISVASSLIDFVDLDTDLIYEMIFSGDGLCPGCETLLQIDWDFTDDLMKCPVCDECFDVDEALAIVLAYQPDQNAGDVKSVRELIRKKKLLQETLLQQKNQKNQLAQTPPASGPPKRGGFRGFIHEAVSLIDTAMSYNMMIPCGYCGKEIAWRAIKCPWCHERMSPPRIWGEW